MRNQTKDKVISIGDVIVDYLGWLTAIALILEIFWLHVSDHILVQTMWPILIVMPAVKLLEICLPHRCDDTCAQECKEEQDEEDDEYQLSD